MSQHISQHTSQHMSQPENAIANEPHATDLRNAVNQAGPNRVPERDEDRTPGRAAHAGKAPHRPNGGLMYNPNVDVCDCGAEVRILADVPGTRADAIDVRFEDGVLSIHAAVLPRSLPGRLLRHEYGVGDYRRSFRLGEGFDASLITAELSHGVLNVRVPRLAAVRPRKVEVRTG